MAHPVRELGLSMKPIWIGNGLAQDLDLLNTIQEALKIANSPQEIWLLWEQPTSH